MTQYSKTHYVKQERFEGPLDLLLDLISREKLPINEISLSKVTEEYLREVEKMESINRDALADFLVIASQLMLLKSRSLLPHLELSKEEEESIGDLERRLREYARLKELAGELKKLERRGAHIEGREAYLGMPTIFYPPQKVSAGVLASVFSSILKTLPVLQELAEEKIRKVISLEEKIREIQARMTASLNQAFSEIIKGSKEKVEVIVSFLAILELAKQKIVSLQQDQSFGDIMVRAGEADTAETV